MKINMTKKEFDEIMGYEKNYLGGIILFGMFILIFLVLFRIIEIDFSNHRNYIWFLVPSMCMILHRRK